MQRCHESGERNDADSGEDGGKFFEAAQEKPESKRDFCKAQRGERTTRCAPIQTRLLNESKLVRSLNQDFRNQPFVDPTERQRAARDDLEEP